MFPFLQLISTICSVVAIGNGGNDRVPSKAMKLKIQYIAVLFGAASARTSLIGKL